MRAKVKIWQFLAVLFLLSSLSFHTKGQDISLNGISSSLLKDTMTLTAGQFGFNALTLTNNTSTNLQVACRVTLPNGWSLLRDLQTLIEIPAGQSSVIPMRIRAGINGYGGVKYPINIELNDGFSAQKTQLHFYVSLLENTKWKVELPQNTIFSQDTDPLPNFSFRIRNQGNRVEFYDIKFESTVRLTVPSEGMQLFIRPGIDTTITVGVRSRTLGQLSDIVRIHINSRSGNKTIEQKLFFISDEYVPRETKYYILPIYLKYQATNLLQPKNIFQNIELNGYLPMKNHSGLSFSYRDNIWLNNISQSNKIYRLNYHTKHSNLDIGTYQDFLYDQIDGHGLSYAYRKEKSNTNVFGVIPRRFSGIILGARQDFNFGEKSQLNGEFLFTNNEDNKIKSKLGVATFRQYSSINNNFYIKAGLSDEYSGKIGTTQKGHTLGAGMSIKLKNITIQSQYANFSKSFPGINRGLIRHNHFVNFKLGPAFIGFFGNGIQRNSLDYTNDFSSIIERFSMKNNQYGGQFGLQVFGGSFYAKYLKFSQLQSSDSNPSAIGQTFSLNYSIRQKKIEQLFSIGRTTSTFGELNNGNPIHGWVSSINGKIGRFGYNGRLDVGPSFYFDFLYYASTNKYPVRQNYNLYYYSNGKGKLRNRFSLDYLKLNNESSASLMVRQDVFLDVQKAELSVSLFSAVNALNLKQRPFLGINIVKTLKTPVPFLKKYNTLKINLFKDVNNNQVRDEGEEAISNAKVLINNNYLRSNKAGDIYLKNVEKGSYKINYQSIDNQKGWTTNSVIEDTIRLNKDLSVSIPFKRAYVLEGKIIYKPADYSTSKSPVLNAIKVTATDSKGLKYYTLTDLEGNFYFNLSRDNYSISIPANLFGSQFRFTQLTAVADLKTKDSDKVSFVLEERKRKINIKRIRD